MKKKRESLSALLRRFERDWQRAIEDLGRPDSKKKGRRACGRRVGPSPRRSR